MRLFTLLILTPLVVACACVDERAGEPRTFVEQAQVDVGDIVAPLPPNSHRRRSQLSGRLASEPMTFDALPEGSQVADAREFERMRAYLQNMSANLTVLKTIQVGSQTFDCIPMREQPSLRNTNEPVDMAPDPNTPGALVLGRPDAICPPNSVPFAQLRMSVLTRFRTLDDFFSKDHGQTSYRFQSRTPAAPVVKHRYVVLYLKDEKTEGVRSTLNIWSPSVAGNDMSLSQTWIVGKTPQSVTQTLESGWQHWRGWDDSRSAPFIYSTRDGYKANDGTKGCYNLRCKGFVQTTPQVVFAPFADALYSVKGGRQGELAIEWRRKSDTGNWWVKMNGVWLGYYPAALFAGATLANRNEPLEVEFGGENTGIAPQAEMGSGEHARFKDGHAAYQSGMARLNPAGQWVAMRPYTQSVDYPDCYSLERVFGAPNNASITKFFFGGPGLRDPACSASAPLL
ncbi:MAG: DUF239 domain-containing protein [Alphaproteobacteria bacterium]|nr:DUF239 domain-containing protein [Alphaproteobacteria bacterium]